MACFLVPAGEAVVTSIVQKIAEKREKRDGIEKTGNTGLSWSRKLSWLNKMLWGGVLLLALEHVWRGEVVLWPPFLTAMKNPADVAPMLHEMATVGTAMAVTVTAVWTVMIVAAETIIKTGKIKKVLVTEAE